MYSGVCSKYPSSCKHYPTSMPHPRDVGLRVALMQLYEDGYSEGCWLRCLLISKLDMKDQFIGCFLPDAFLDM